MRPRPSGTFGAQLKALREGAGYTQEELATIAGLSVHGISALERGERRRPHVETVRALSAALDLTGAVRDALLRSARTPQITADDLADVPLPLPLTSLLGRDAEVTTLRHWLADARIRLITLTGTGGAGKTRLALELARTLAADGGTRVVFVPLAGVRDASFVAPAIAEALKLADAAAADLPRRALAVCRDRLTLLVVDNFEHVLDAASLIAELLKWVPLLKVLVTSRAPLRLQGEREFAVKPLVMGDDSERVLPADLARIPAVRLFLERVRDVQPDFRLTASNAPAVAAICRRLDGLPLALELVAPWLKVLTVEDLLRQLTDDVLLSSIGARDLPERQQTMTATIGWSYQLLDPEEQRAFRRLGALPGLFPIDAAAAALTGPQPTPAAFEGALRATAVLMDKSLLLRADRSVVSTCPVYYMLDTVRAYAARELAFCGERDAAFEGLVRYCMDEASCAAECLVGADQVEWLDRVREDLESYRAVLAWLLDAGRLADASHIASSLYFFWVIRGHAAEGLGWYERILNQPAVPPVVEAKALVGAATMRYTHGTVEAARPALTRAVALARDSGDLHTLARASYVFGHVELAIGNVDAARDLFTRSLDDFRTLAVPWGVGSSLSGLAWVALASGHAGRVEPLLDEATLALGNAGPWFLSLVAYLRAVAMVRRGDADRAIALVRESLERILDLHDRFAFVYALVPLAVAAALKGEDAWAARIMGARDSATERIGSALVDQSVDDLKVQAERDVRARLGPDGWKRAYEAGRIASLDAVLKDIDAVRGPR